jgi:hypothetical protein
MPTLKELVSFLKERQLKSSFPRKEDIIKYLSDIKWAFDFPWETPTTRNHPNLFDSTYKFQKNISITRYIWRGKNMYDSWNVKYGILERYVQDVGGLFLCIQCLY